MEKEAEKIKQEIRKFLLALEEFKVLKKDAAKLIEKSVNIKLKLLYASLDESISRDDFERLSSLFTIAERCFRNIQEMRWLLSPLR